MLSVDQSVASVWRRRREAIRLAAPEASERELHALATATRLSVLDMIERAGQGHIGGDFSVADILTLLFNKILNIDPADPRMEGRDVFILSKGHAAAALYATLSSTGFFSPTQLEAYLTTNSDLNGHPARTKVPGVETSTGPLGHGLPVAVGAAVGARLRGAAARVYVVVGDGELQEGSNWEAMMAAAQFKLGNLCLIVDRNRLQQGARTEETNALDPLDEKIRAFGFAVREVSGHDFEALEEAMRPDEVGRPIAIIANTVKGKGVSFIEDRVEWHHKVPTPEQFIAAREELAG